jgi:peptidoglycan hydrolase-like protein with peptidoglycan-binding domain
MPTTTRRVLITMATMTAGVAGVAVAPAPAHAAPAPTIPAPGTLATPATAEDLAQLRAEVGKLLDAPQTNSLGTCRSWHDITSGNLLVRVPSLTRNGSLNCDLRNGNFNNDAVYKLQDALHRCYGQQQVNPPDGDFGDRTTEAVKNAQNFHGQDPDGIYDPALGSVMFLPIYDRYTGAYTGDCLL